MEKIFEEIDLLTKENYIKKWRNKRFTKRFFRTKSKIEENQILKNQLIKIWKNETIKESILSENKIINNNNSIDSNSNIFSSIKNQKQIKLTLKYTIHLMKYLIMSKIM